MNPLELVSLGVTYPDGDWHLDVLKDVSLAMRQSEFAALTGESGSGKSTLLTVSALLTAPTSGTVLIGGTDAWQLNDRERTTLRREKIGLVFQQPNLFASLSAREQLLVAADVQGKLRRGASQAAQVRADELLELVGLADKRDRLPHQLSGGQRQRVNIARALMNGPELLLADEPTSALDEDMSGEIVGLIARIVQETGVACLMVTHDKTHLAGCDRVLELQRGHLN